MDFNFDVGGRYVPKWLNNQSQAEEKQIVIEWEYPTAKERSLIQYLTPYKITIEGKMKDEVEYKIDTIKLVEICVKKIKNLTYKGTGIETGERLVNTPGFYGLVDEVAAYLIPKLREIEEKN